MKLKTISILMIASMVASVLMVSMVSTGSAQYLIGATAKFYMYLSPNGLNYFNATAAHSSLTIGSKYNLTIGIANVTHFNSFGFSMIWNSSQMLWDGNYWLSALFTRETVKNWSAPTWAYMGNDISDDMFGGILGNPHIGAVEGFASTGLTAKHNLTGTFDILTMEFIAEGYGAEGFWIWKDPTGYSPTNPLLWPLPQCYQEFVGAYYYGILPGTTYWITSSGWMDTSGTVQPYDVVWCIFPYFNPLYNTMIPSPCANALLWISPPAPYGPSASEALSSSTPTVGQTVTDTITQTGKAFNSTGFNNIAQVTIDWNDTTVTTSAFTPPSIAFNHAYSTPGSYTIKIKCFAAHQPSGAQWYNFTSPITVYPKVTSGIDVYEVRHPLWAGDAAGYSGLGPGVPGRPYDPQALVVLSANVTYNGAGVQCKIVSFQVNVTTGPSAGKCILFRTCLTNSTGYANMTFRIPVLCWEYGGPSALFGKWTVFVSVSMCEETYMDNMSFDMGYILTLSNMFALPPTSVKVGQTISFNATVTNIDWASAGNVPGTLILTVFDTQDVPIGQFIVSESFPGEAQFCHPKATNITISLTIPKYAYVGTATGYLDLFTGLPALGGLAYCPEVSATFRVVA